MRLRYRLAGARPARLRRATAVFGLMLLSLEFLFLPAAVAGATGAAGATHFSVSINGKAGAMTSDARPAQLYPDKPAELHIVVTNGTTGTLHVETIRLQGDALSLPLFSYDTEINLVVPPGKTKSLTFPVVLTSIGGEATGLIDSTVSALKPNGDTIASVPVVTKVNGSLVSVYGFFGLAVLVLTILSLGLALLALARHQLSQNRWGRAVRFMIPGFGVGLILTFTMSAFAVFTPGPGHWVPLLVVPTAVGLALGYLTPAPNEEEYDDYDENVLLAQIVVVDEDPLEADGQTPERASPVLTRPSGRISAPDSRPTAGGGAPDSRPTADPGVPDSRPTADPGVPDSRPTTGGAVPDSRPTTGGAVPDSRPTTGGGVPDGRPTTGPGTTPDQP